MSRQEQLLHDWFVSAWLEKGRHPIVRKLNVWLLAMAVPFVGGVAWCLFRLTEILKSKAFAERAAQSSW